MKTKLTMKDSLKREKSMIFPQDFSEHTLRAVAHSKNCITALEKQIPKEISEIYQARIEEFPGKYILSGNCPVCGSAVPKKHWYCWSCGQRLIWPEN